MHLPVQAQPINRQAITISSKDGVVPSELVNSAIKAALKEIGIDYFGDKAGCAFALGGVLNSYTACLGRPGSSERGCARSAAFLIRDGLCGSYCDCG